MYERGEASIEVEVSRLQAWTENADVDLYGRNGDVGLIREYRNERSSATTVTYALTADPGVSCTGTMKFPDVRQFDEHVYMLDSAGAVPSAALLLGMSKTVRAYNGDSQ